MKLPVTIPNMLTILRFILIPLIAYLLYSGKPGYVLASAVIFIIAVLTDQLDGYIARNFNQKSVFGTFFDPIVDKMLILTAFFIFVDLRLLPVWMILLIMFREFLVTGIRQVCSKPKKIVGANWMGKSKFIMQTANVVYLQLVLYFALAHKNIMLFNTMLFTQPIGYCLTLIVTLISLGYAFNFLYWHKKELLSGI